MTIRPPPNPDRRAAGFALPAILIITGALFILALAALWVTGPAFRFPEESLARMGEIVSHHARQLSEHLGCPAR